MFPSAKSMSLPLPLTIKNPSSLSKALHKIETEAMEATGPDAPLVSVTRRINKKTLEVRSRLTIKNGTYVLFYVDGKRQSRSRIPELLGVI